VPDLSTFWSSLATSKVSSYSYRLDEQQDGIYNRRAIYVPKPLSQIGLGLPLLFISHDPFEISPFSSGSIGSTRRVHGL
jgi:hypothetical protein